ncbi:putative WRKY transcription factor 2 [Sesamum alatum]|uniref:WRKY transcription factor 2 n=1 Tax=Sesamum alatum TaxID=300844 RepID=A0AAE2CFW4_9LAMI|nr:putative WRKY transcription factor 2 [Sesamum alatum]
MGGFDNHVAVMGDWMPPSPSPRAFFTSMIADDVVARAIADSSVENKSCPQFLGPEGHSASGNADRNDLRQASTVGDEASNSSSLTGPKVSARGGLMERIAARAGFNAPRLNTESIKPADLSKNQEVRSPYLTIPPGLSPATLLESPVFLSNSLVLPSPTTGKFSFAPSGNNQNSTLVTDDPDKGKENTSGDTSSFAFNPIPESGSIPYFNAANKAHDSGFAPQSFPGVGVSAHSDTSFLHQSVERPEIQTISRPHAEKKGSSDLSLEQTYHSVGFAENSPPLDEPHEDDGDQRSSGDNIGGGQPEDGYNWRKYGQKQVKGSEYPRSYYKCTHPNCPVKKKVERSHEGHITEIIYKGAHNHPKPPPNRRSVFGSSNALSDIQVESEQPGTGANGDLVWSTVQNGNAPRAPDWKQDNLEATSSAQLVHEYSNGATFQAQNGAQYEPGDAVDGSPFSNDEEDDDQATHASVSLGYDGEGDESESKRRRIETFASEMSGATRAIREPRVVVQTTSEVDILDDGYRWRKYGQKVVKGNPNPRSYYKCTSAGCNVRKHVERASHDLKSVITTYEGKHNHDVPAARNSSHINSGPQNTHPAQQAHGAAVSSQIHRPEPSQIHNSAARFERPGMGSFGLPGRPQLGLGPGFGFGMNQPGLASLGLAGLSRILPVHPYLGHQPRPMNDMGSMLPKAEPKLEPLTDSGLNSSNSSSVYQQLIGRLPLGPQM